MTAKKDSSLLQRVNSIYRRQIAQERRLGAIHALGDLQLQSGTATIQLLTATVQSLEADNKTLRRYLGKMLHERRLAAAAQSA